MPNIKSCDKTDFCRAHSFACARLGTGSAGLNELIGLELLATKVGKHGRTAICEFSLRSFERRFVKAAAYAPLLECHPTSALKQLRKMGVTPINDLGSESVKFVSRAEVERLVSLELRTPSHLEELRAIQREITSSLAENSVPATVSLTADPTITVRATTGRWSFHVEIEKLTATLTAHFRASKEYGRLNKIIAMGCEPEEIWPGASVLKVQSGGFEIVDRHPMVKRGKEKAQSLTDLCARRSLELHRLL